MKFQSLKGMDDLVFPEISDWQALEEKARVFLEAYGFREIRTPILESTELFSRSIGEASDIVHKEMYTFEDRGARSLTLRPEMTAGVVRSVLEHGLLKQGEPVFLYYIGPMFRAERPQAGRKRQFHQIGVETLNTHSYVNDVELIVMACDFLTGLGLKDFSVSLNHLGSEEDRKNFALSLEKYFQSVRDKLCNDCQFRLSRNVLRILDCKTDSCQPLISKAPKAELSGNAKTEFDQVCSRLKESKIPFRIEPRLVRGLDYYTGLVFETTAAGLGSQNAVLAGGRYDHLIHDLGGPETGASGFSIGVERLASALEASGVHLGEALSKQSVYVAAIVNHEENCSFYRNIAQGLAQAGRRSHFSFAKGSLTSHLSRANKLNVGFALIVGEEEWQKGEVSLKNMASGVQKRVKPDQLAQAFEGF